MTAIGIISGMILFDPVQTFAQEPIKVLINGESLNFEVSPRIEEGTTLVPFRAIFEKLGLKVDYIDLGATGQIIKGSKAGLTISMFIGSKDVLVNDHNMTLEKPPVIIDGITMVPLRFVGEVTGNTVQNSKSGIWFHLFTIIN
ncbi:copper amine oxidase N-terminal domain-containing protein [Paenibacillus sp. TAB 01]|uniref:copper amine oxidase N-terminal domain-containing protein n=1 Tax=Paenibacillus sp. TAB 01 TaxID=3368988 RepID=UPI003752FA9D